MSQDNQVPQTIFAQPGGGDGASANPAVTEALQKLTEQREKALAEQPDPYQVSFKSVPSGAAHAGAASDGAAGDGGLSELLPESAVVTLGSGVDAREVTIRKWRVGDLKVITTNLTLLGVTITHMTPFNLTDEELIHLLAEQQPEALGALIAHTLSMKMADVDNLDLDDFEKLGLMLYRVNISFFSKSQGLAKRLTEVPILQTSQSEAQMTGST